MSIVPVTTRVCQVIQVDLLPYTEAWAWQRRLAAERSAGRGPDTLLLLEHPPTITLGSKADPTHVLADSAELARRGVACVPTDRGGDVTYHAPGQLVGYPILKLGPLGIGVVDYVRRLEELIIRLLARYTIVGERVSGLSGVWVKGGTAKIAAVGVKVSAAGVTTHGFALNRAPAMLGFTLIVPCGIADRGVTSIEQLLGWAPPRTALTAQLIELFGEVFAVDLLQEYTAQAQSF